MEIGTPKSFSSVEEIVFPLSAAAGRYALEQRI